MKESYDFISLVFGTLLLFFLPYVSWGIGQHHNQGLEVYSFQDILYTPAGGVCYLPDEPEGAMGGLIDRL
ncbi:hypothetical protein [Phocaeicola vulgatus]|uniref:hypothetical protein n=1 Tax=Phocaeicola vulgatus TaxID=821 RepID=UPI0034A2460D